MSNELIHTLQNQFKKQSEALQEMVNNIEGVENKIKVKALIAKLNSGKLTLPEIYKEFEQMGVIFK